MRVVFLEDVPGVADAATVKNVKNGYARNYLLPRKLAAPATPTELQALDRIEKAAQVKRNKLSADAQEVEASIRGVSVNLELRAGPTGRLFGAVTSRMIASELSKLTSWPLDHRNVILGDSIKDVGEYEVNIRIYRDVLTSVKVTVAAENQEGIVPEEAGVEAPEATELDNDVAETLSDDSETDDNQ